MGLKVRQAELSNGLQLYSIRTPSRDVALVARINAGSLYEDESQAGISHLVEHCLFLGTGKRKDRGVIETELKELGGAHFAHTAPDHIALGIKVVISDFEQSLELVADLLYNSLLEPEKIELEKRMVYDEIRVRHDNYELLLCEALRGIVFEGTPLARPVIGSQATLEGLSAEVVREFYMKSFTPSNTNLFVVGNVGHERLLRLVEKYFSVNHNTKNRLKPMEFSLKPHGSRRLVIERALENLHFTIGQSLMPHCNQEAYAIAVASSLLRTALMIKTSSTSAPSYTCSVDYDFPGEASSITVSISCAPENFEATKKIVVDEFRNLAEGRLQKGQFRPAQQYLRKEFMLQFEPMNIARHMLEFSLRGNAKEIQGYLGNIWAVDMERVATVAKKHLNPDGLAEVIIGRLS